MKYRERLCLDCESEWKSRVVYSSLTTNLSGERTEWCKSCGSANIRSGPLMSTGFPRTHADVEMEIELTLGQDAWASHPVFTVSDWKYEVANGETRSGYKEWLYNRLMNEDEEDL